MAVYHFQQQPLIPPGILDVSLPNDKLWQTTSAADWTSQASPTQGKYYADLGKIC